MFRRLSVLVLTVICAICLLGCISVQEDSIPTEKEMDETENQNIEVNDETTTETTQNTEICEKTEETPASVVANADDEKICSSIEKHIAEEYILGDFFTIEDIVSIIGVKEKSINERFEGTALFSSGGRGDEFYVEFYNDEYGLYFISLRNRGVKYIEIEAENVAFLGIDQQSTFDEVEQVLGETNLIIIEDGLPGLKRYELVYEYNQNFMRIYSFDLLGESGLYFCFTDEYEARYGVYEITTEEINRYFNMTKNALQTELGVSENINSNYLRYKEVSFGFNEEGTELQEIYLGGNFQISNLRDYMSIEKTQSIMGNGEITEHMTSEDGIQTILKYEFDDFLLEVNYLLGEDRFPWWDIIKIE